MRHSSAITAAAVTAAALTLAAPAVARPTLHLTLPSQSTAGQAIPFTVTDAHLARHDTLVLQRQEGTAHRWQTVKRLPRAAKITGSLPGLPAGRYTLRAADLAHKLYSTAPARVFGTVPLGEILNGDTTTETVNLPNQTFSYFWSLSLGESFTANASRNDCRSVHLDAAYTTGSSFRNGGVGNPAGVLQVNQESRDPTVINVAPETEGSLDATLIPGQSWSINNTTATTNGSGLTFYLNGTASCLTTDTVD